MSHKKGLSPEEIATLLQELSDNESKGKELSEMGWESDEENFIPSASYESKDAERYEYAKNNVSQNTKTFTASNSSWWEEPSSMNACGKLSNKIFYLKIAA